MKKTIALVLSLAAFAPTVGAHVVLEQKTAPAASYYKATFMVGHGCNGSATTGITIRIPEGVVNIKPMPKPGWTLATRVEKLPKPYELHGKAFTEGVVEVNWKGGSLADAHYDEFVMLTRLPDAPGKYYFPILQTCEGSENRWEEIPAEGKTTRDYKMPAAQLEVLPVEEHKHH